MSATSVRCQQPKIQYRACCMACSYLYVEDVAEAFDVILHRGKVGEIYNIGTQKERTVNEVAADIAKIFQLPTEKITHVRDRAFNDQRYDCCVRLSEPGQRARSWHVLPL